MAKITLNEKEKELDIDLWIIMIVSSPRSVKVAAPLCAAKAAIPCGLAVRKQHNCCPPPASLKKKPESDKEF